MVGLGSIAHCHQGGKSFCKRSLLSSCMEWHLEHKNAEEGTLYRAELSHRVKKQIFALGLCLQLVCKYCDLCNS